MVLSKDDNLSKGFFSTAEPLVVIVLAVQDRKRKRTCFLPRYPRLLNKVLISEPTLRSPTPYPFTNHFWQKCYPQGGWLPPYIIIWRNDTLSNTLFRALHASSLLTAVNALSFKIWIYHNTKTFSRLFHRHKMHLLALLGLFTDRNDKFPYSFIYILQLMKFLSEKGIPFGLSPP